MNDDSKDFMSHLQNLCHIYKIICHSDRLSAVTISPTYEKFTKVIIT